MLDLSRHFPGDHNPKMPWEEGGKKASEIAENTKRQVLFGVFPTIEAFQLSSLPLSPLSSHRTAGSHVFSSFPQMFLAVIVDPGKEQL